MTNIPPYEAAKRKKKERLQRREERRQEKITKRTSGLVEFVLNEKDMAILNGNFDGIPTPPWADDSGVPYDPQYELQPQYESQIVYAKRIKPILEKIPVNHYLVVDRMSAQIRDVKTFERRVEILKEVGLDIGKGENKYGYKMPLPQEDSALRELIVFRRK